MYSLLQCSWMKTAGEAGEWGWGGGTVAKGETSAEGKEWRWGGREKGERKKEREEGGVGRDEPVEGCRCCGYTLGSGRR